MKRETRPLKISEILNNYFDSHRYIYYRVKMESAVHLWNRIDDPIIMKNTRAMSARDGILIVKTKSPVVSNELSLREKELVNKINSLIGENLVKRIIFKSGFFKNEKKNGKFKLNNENKISYKTVKKIEYIVRDIKDEELKSLLKRLFLESYRFKKSIK